MAATVFFGTKTSQESQRPASESTLLPGYSLHPRKESVAKLEHPGSCAQSTPVLRPGSQRQESTPSLRSKQLRSVRTFRRPKSRVSNNSQKNAHVAVGVIHFDSTSVILSYHDRKIVIRSREELCARNIVPMQRRAVSLRSAVFYSLRSSSLSVPSSNGQSMVMNPPKTAAPRCFKHKLTEWSANVAAIASFLQPTRRGHFPMTFNACY